MVPLSTILSAPIAAISSSRVDASGDFDAINSSKIFSLPGSDPRIDSSNLILIFTVVISILLCFLCYRRRAFIALPLLHLLFAAALSKALPPLLSTWLPMLCLRFADLFLAFAHHCLALPQPSQAILRPKLCLSIALYTMLTSAPAFCRCYA